MIGLIFTWLISAWSRSDMQDCDLHIGPPPGTPGTLLTGDTGDATDITDEDLANTEPGLIEEGSMSP